MKTKKWHHYGIKIEKIMEEYCIEVFGDCYYFNTLKEAKAKCKELYEKYSFEIEHIY